MLLHLGPCLSPTLVSGGACDFTFWGQDPTWTNGHQSVALCGARHSLQETLTVERQGVRVGNPQNIIYFLLSAKARSGHDESSQSSESRDFLQLLSSESVQDTPHNPPPLPPLKKKKVSYLKRTDVRGQCSCHLSLLLFTTQPSPTRFCPRTQAGRLIQTRAVFTVSSVTGARDGGAEPPGSRCDGRETGRPSSFSRSPPPR